MLKRIIAGTAIGVDAYRRGDYATALRFWQPLAEQGNAEAQFNLGNMYKRGDGVPQEFAEATRLYRLAAEQGGDVRYEARRGGGSVFRLVLPAATVIPSESR